jgi:hypothetical protein
MIRDLTMDAAKPSTSLTLPSNNYYYKNLATISGTVSENKNGDKVFVQVQDLTRGTTYWSQTLGSWVNYSTWSQVAYAGSGNWSLNVGAGNFTSGHRYEVKCYATDAVGNVEDAPDGISLRDRYFYFDNTVPVSQVSIPSNITYRSDTLLTVSGTCNNDPAPAGGPNAAGMGAGKIQVLISKGSDSLFWNNATKTWAAAQNWNDAAQVGGVWTSWTMAVSSPTAFDNGVTYVVRSKAIDGAYDAATEAVYSGNNEFDGTLAGSSVTFVYDNIPPTSLIR